VCFVLVRPKVFSGNCSPPPTPPSPFPTAAFPGVHIACLRHAILKSPRFCGALFFFLWPRPFFPVPPRCFPSPLDRVPLELPRFWLLWFHLFCFLALGETQAVPLLVLLGGGAEHTGLAGGQAVGSFFQPRLGSIMLFLLSF